VQHSSLVCPSTVLVQDKRPAWLPLLWLPSEEPLRFTLPVLEEDRALHLGLPAAVLQHWEEAARKTPVPCAPGEMLKCSPPARAAHVNICSLAFSAFKHASLAEKRSVNPQKG